MYIHPGVKDVETQYGLKLLLLFLVSFVILVIEKFSFSFFFPRIIHPILVPLSPSLSAVARLVVISHCHWLE